jgi:hypothetical protein
MTTKPRVVRVAAVENVHCTKTSQGVLQPLFQEINDSAHVARVKGLVTTG